MTVTAISRTASAGRSDSGIPNLSIISFLPGKSKNFGTPLAPIMNRPTSPVRTQPVIRCVLDDMQLSLLCECEVLNRSIVCVHPGRSKGGPHGLNSLPTDRLLHSPGEFRVSVVDNHGPPDKKKCSEAVRKERPGADD